MDLLAIPVVVLSLMDPLYIAFGWVMRVLYDVTGNFGTVIILFTIILRGLMIPLGINQQKSSLKQRALQGEIAAIQRAYPNDKQKQSQLQMELYKKHGASPLKGCLPAILQLIIIWPIFRIIQAPLVHLMGVTGEKIESIAAYLNGLTNASGDPLLAESLMNRAVMDNMPLVDILNNNASALAEVVNRGYLRIDQLINLRLFGLDLSLRPSYDPRIIFGAETWPAYLPLLAIPILVVLTTLIQLRITRMTTPNRKQAKEDKEREKINPARAGQAPEDKSESMMKTMNFIMPIFMLITTFSMPASMGLYWIIGNTMMIAQSVYIYLFFTKRIEKAQQGAVVKPQKAQDEKARA
jgi:YidC/Oxa1 family membrane protein insertase